MADGIIITAHAVDRFVERWAPNLARDVAARKLSEIVHRARFIRGMQCTKNNCEAQIWRGPRPLKIRMVVVMDDGIAKIATVLPPFQGAVK